MPHISEMRDSKFLKKEDCGDGITVTIAGCQQMNVAMESQAPDLKWCLSFTEDLKPMVMNATNAQLIAAALGSENTDDWIGQKIVLYNDASIMFQGKLTGGIRARAAKSQKAPLPSGAVDAMRQAWRSYQDANKGEASEVVAAGWKALVAAWFPGKPKEVISAAQWNSLIDNKFKMPPTMANVVSEEKQFEEDSIPF